MRKTVILIHKISQTADSLGRTSVNLGKDIRTVASGVAYVGDSAEVYAVNTVSVSSYQLSIKRMIMLK